MPSERYGNTNKASIKNNNSESYNDKYNSSKVAAPPPLHHQQQQLSGQQQLPHTFSSSKVTTTKPSASSSVVITSRPLTKSKVTMNLGFNMKQYSTDPSSSIASSNNGCAYNPPINDNRHNNSDNRINFEETTSNDVDFDTLNNSMMMMSSSCNNSNNPWINESNFDRSTSLNDVIELLHPTADDYYNDDINNNNNNDNPPNNSPARNSSSRNSICHDNGDHTDNDNYQPQQVYDHRNYGDPDNYLCLFELDDDDLNNFFYNDTG